MAKKKATKTLRTYTEPLWKIQLGFGDDPRYTYHVVADYLETAVRVVLQHRRFNKRLKDLWIRKAERIDAAILVAGGKSTSNACTDTDKQ